MTIRLGRSRGSAAIRFTFAIALGLTSVSSVAFQLRGNDMVYDALTNLTWLATPPFGAGSSFDDGFSAIDGRMTYASAQAWVSQLSVLSPDNDVLIDDWRLPSILDLAISTCGPSGCDPLDPNASPTVGHSEVFNLLYGSLGNEPKHLLPKTGPFRQVPGSIGGPAGFVWLDSLYPLPLSFSGKDILTVEGHFLTDGSGFPIFAWAILPAEGLEGPAVSEPSVFAMEGFAWAVRTGDVSAVPLPGALALLTFGLSILAPKTHRRVRS